MFFHLLKVCYTRDLPSSKTSFIIQIISPSYIPPRVSFQSLPKAASLDYLENSSRCYKQYLSASLLSLHFLRCPRDHPRSQSFIWCDLRIFCCVILGQEDPHTASHTLPECHTHIERKMVIQENVVGHQGGICPW